MTRSRLTIIVAMLPAVLLALSTLSALSASGTTHYVSPGDDVQATIDAAAPGDAIQFAPGDYSLPSTINVNKSLTLNSADPYSETKPLLDGGGTLASIIFIDADAAVVDGLEIANGTGDLILQSGAHAGTIVKNCVVHNSSGDEGIQLKQCTDCTVEFNKVYNVAQDGISIADGSHSSLVSNNEIYSSFSENAAIYVYDSHDITVESNYVHDTQAANGIMFYKNYGTTHIIANNLIVQNSWRGGKHCYDEADGNAVNVYKPRVLSTYVVSHNTIDDNNPANACAQPGNAVYANDGSGVGFGTSIESNILTNHGGYGIRTYYGAQASYSCNDLWQNARGATDGNPTDGGGNLSADPLFNVDYSLQAGSPAIGAACDSRDMGVDFSKWGYSPSLQLNKEVGPPVVEMGAQAVFTITATNNGPGIAHGVVITDEVDSGLEISHVVASEGTVGRDGQTITVCVGSIDRGETVTVTIEVTATALGTKANTAHLTSLKAEQVDSNTVPLEVGRPALPRPAYYLPLALSSGVDNTSAH